MANTIKLKRGTGSDPSASDLVLGEIAIRTDTGKLFTKKDNGTVAEISGSGGGGSDIFINTLSSSSGSGGGSASFNGSATRFTLSNPPDVSAQQLLVSINGVIQKPNSGTSPSEGFALDGTDIIFAAAPATGADFFIITYGSIGLSVPADNSVTSAKIVDGTIVGTDLATNIDLVDNQKIRFGTGNDLQIYHDGSYSRIHSANHELLIRAGGVFNISNGDGTENLLRATVNGSVELYHDNSKKLETTANGLYITGAAVFPDGSSNGIQIGNSSDLQIYHDGTNSYIKNLTGYLNVNANLLYLGNQANNETYILAQQNGSVNLYYDNSKKFETDTNGITVTGRVLASGTSNIGFAGLDNVKLSLGTSDDLKIHHDGSNSYIDNNTGALNIRSLGSGANVQIIADNDYMARFVNDGAAELYYDNVKKFETTSAGVLVSAGHLDISDNQFIRLGASADLQIYHNGNHSKIRDLGTGNLYIESVDGNIYLRVNDNEQGVTLVENGAVELYYDNGKRIETTTYGITVTGNSNNPTTDSWDTNSSIITSGSYGGGIAIIDGSRGFVQYLHGNGVNWELRNAATDSTPETNIKAIANGAVELYYDNSKKFYTTLTGAYIENRLDIGGANLGWSYPKPLNVQGSSGAILALRNWDTTTYAADTMTSIDFNLRTGNTGNQNGSCEIRAFKENGTNGNNARGLSFYTGANGGSPEERMRIDSSGRLLLGLTSGTSALLQVDEGVQVFGAANDANSSCLTMDYSSGTGRIMGHGSSGGNLAFFTNVSGSGVTERMRITSNGFSKHTSDSGNYFSSTGNYHEFRSNSGNNPNTIFFHNGVGNTQFGIKIQTANEQNDTSHHFIDCREGGSATRRFIVYANGNVQNSNNSYGQLSDIKLKENVVDSNSQWNDIKQLKVRNFNFKNDNTNLKQIGLIAQEAEIVCPSLVFESQDQEEDAETGEIKDKGTTTKSVKYSVLYMKAIKCLQEAMARIEALETKVAALEAK